MQQKWSLGVPVERLNIITLAAFQGDLSVFVLDKSAKSKKRDGGTPDKMSSPIGSAVHIPDELCTGPSVGKVISGDDIDSLAINVEELKKVNIQDCL